MKVGITRQEAEAMIARIDSTPMNPGDPRLYELTELRGKLQKRLEQTAAVQKLTAAELSALLAVIRQTRTPNMLIGSQLETAAPKLQAMLGAYQANGGGDEDNDEDGGR